MSIDGFVIIGPPGSGKSTIGRAVAHELNMAYVSSGDIARKLAIFDKSTSDNLDRGGMADETLMRSVIHSILYDINYHGNKFILDGFPRNIDQLEWLLNRFPRLLFYVIDVPISECMIRLLARGRKDDIAPTIHNRIDYYDNMTQPMVDKIGVHATIIEDGNIDMMTRHISHDIIEMGGHRNGIENSRNR